MTAPATANNTPAIIRILLLDDREVKEIKEKFEFAINANENDIIPDDLKNKISLEIQSFSLSEKFMDALDEGCVQIAIIDWNLDVPPESDKEPGPQKLQQVDLIRRIKDLRPEIQIWVMTRESDRLSINRQVLAEDVKFLEKREIEENVVRVMKEVMTRFNEVAETPFWTEFKNYVDQQSSSWHVPGHNRGNSLNSAYVRNFKDFFGDNAFASDHAVPKKKIGSLLQSSKKIGEAQKLAAKTFGAKETYFVTNGNSAANKIILQTLIRPGRHVLVARNCHQSIHYGIIQSGAIPVYIDSKFHEKLEFFAPPSLQSIEEKLNEYKGKVDLLVVTGCTYEGILIDVKRIKELCEDHNVKLMVDEAWFGYSAFYPYYRNYCALRNGADYVTQSAHKMLSSFRQSAFIHINDPEFEEKHKNFFRELFYSYTSTSPQYQLVASMDVATMQMRVEGYQLIRKAHGLAEQFKTDISSLKHIRLVEPETVVSDFKKQGQDFQAEGIGFDPLKVTMDVSKLNWDTKDLVNEIEEQCKMDFVKYTKNSLQILFTIGTEFRPVQDLIKKLKDIDERPVPKSTRAKRVKVPEIEELEDPPQKFFFGNKKPVKYTDAEGELSACLVTPYPPGIPILVPGQKVTKGHITYIKYLIRQESEVHGLCAREWLGESKKEYIYVSTQDK